MYERKHMEIKLIKNFEVGVLKNLNKNLIIHVVDDNRQLDQFNGKRIFLFNPKTNKQIEIAPEIPKFCMASYYYSTHENHFFIFLSARMANESDVALSFYVYDLETGKSKLIYSLTETLAAIRSGNILKVFHLTEDYCLFQHKVITEAGEQFELLLKDVKNEKQMHIENQFLTSYGIDSLIPLEKNVCGIKIGESCIGVINVNQFVSDMVLGLDLEFRQMLDCVNDEYAIEYIKENNGNLLYTKRDIGGDAEEIIMYDYANDVKRIRQNDRLSDQKDFDGMYIVNDIPYRFFRNDRGTKLINLNTQKSEYRFGIDVKVEMVLDDMVVISRRKKLLPFSKKISDYIEVYRFQEFRHTLYKTKGKFGGCINHFGDLLIFTI